MISMAPELRGVARFLLKNMLDGRRHSAAAVAFEPVRPAAERRCSFVYAH